MQAMQKKAGEVRKWVDELADQLEQLALTGNYTITGANETGKASGLLPDISAELKGRLGKLLSGRNSRIVLDNTGIVSWGKGQRRRVGFNTSYHGVGEEVRARWEEKLARLDGGPNSGDTPNDKVTTIPSNSPTDIVGTAVATDEPDEEVLQLKSYADPSTNADPDNPDTHFTLDGAQPASSSAVQFAMGSSDRRKQAKYAGERRAMLRWADQSLKRQHRAAEKVWHKQRHNLRQQVRRLQKKLDESRERERELERERDATSQETESPLELFERAVALAGVLTANINGMEQLSLSTGAFVLALETQCGLSAEKLPQALVYVMGMYLGKLDPAIVAKLVKANDTWALSRERFARVAECLSKNTYMQPNTVAHLQMDDSNKGDTDLTCLPTTVRMGPVGQEVVRPRALLQLEALTKKSTASTRVAESIVEQLGAEGAARILGGTTDAFGAATAAMKAVLHEFDRLAAEHPNGLQIPSDRVPGVFYDLSAPIRELRSFLCHMHNSERMYVPMQTSLLGQPGLEHQGHTAQQMYSLNNSMKKQHGFFDTLDLLSVGGNVEDLKKLDCAARKLMGKPALARWTTLGRSARQWVTKLAVPGALPIQNHVMGLLGGPNSAKWLDLCRFGTCIGSNELSHLVLVLAGLAHSSTPQAAEQCWTTLGTCCAPVHRIAAVMSSGIYDLQMEDVTFADGKSGTHAATAISTRATEVVEADRRSAFKLHGLRDHWPTRLPQAYQYLLAESARAVELGLCQRPDEYVELFNNLMKKGTAGIPEATDKYLVAPYCRPGLLPLHFCCPATVRYCAAALLDALSEDGFVAAPLPAPPDPNLQVYPQLTGGQLQQKIRAGLTNAEQRQAVYRAYQLSHPEFVKELLRLVADPRAQPCAANNVPMTCFDPSDTTTQKQWWVYLDTDYRLAPELITKLFSCMSITSTAAEQYFSTATHISETNATPASNASALHFFHNVRKASEEYTMEALGKKAAALESSIRPRQGRSLEGRVARSNGLHEVIADMTTNEPHLVYPTVSNLRPPEGKRRARVQENYNANLEVMAQNAAKKSKSIEYGSVEKLVEDMSAAKISGAKKIQLTPTPELVAQKMTKAQLIARMVELRAVQEKDAAGLQRRLHGELVAMLLAFQQQPVEPIDSEGEQEPEAVAET